MYSFDVSADDNKPITTNEMWLNSEHTDMKSAPITIIVFF
ncbi:hypothetical protein PG5_60310 [Pseudomonas sp. G5(2012)]|nr:hypothetical protein PG5_60310 [Pseudomonas sp. G5(2012)]